MKLVSFTVKNYRSIIQSYEIILGKSTVLVGPNNEGKSNILRALVAAMRILTNSASNRAIFRTITQNLKFHVGDSYDWELDYPINLQKSKPLGKSEMLLEFELTTEENTNFKKQVKSKLNGNLPLKIEFDNSSYCKIIVKKKGKGGTSLSLKTPSIIKFIDENLDFEYIPAVRTAETAHEIVNELVSKELKKLEKELEYIEATKKIDELQRPILNSITSGIESTLKEFLPNIKSVNVEINTQARLRFLRRNCEIIIDDGTPTPLQYKGDGIQSLSALSIMRHSSEDRAHGRNLIIAIEEPESHLHPFAIRGLKAVLFDLSQKHQVIFSTHCPLFVDRANIKSNIIVFNKRAKPAKNIEEIRKILGVNASDNLRHAELVLIVEGEDDKITLEALFKSMSTLIGSSFINGKIVIETLSGASNLAYKVSNIKNSLCNFHCILDGDKAGKVSYEKARNEGLLTLEELNFINCKGKEESELEDWLNKELYEKTIKAQYGVFLNIAEFKNKKKWSVRIKDAFLKCGKTWNDNIEKEVKMKIAQLVVMNPKEALNNNYVDNLKIIIETLENKLID